MAQAVLASGSGIPVLIAVTVLAGDPVRSPSPNTPIVRCHRPGSRPYVRTALLVLVVISIFASEW